MTFLWLYRAEAKELRERYMQKYHGGVGGVSQAVQPVTSQVGDKLAGFVAVLADPVLFCNEIVFFIC